ncbi:transposable element Tcb2 transposase [Trichonephila clavipes]|nr:transposable element Tcb2 transposase [Trichonephila clavipes]
MEIIGASCNENFEAANPNNIASAGNKSSPDLTPCDFWVFPQLKKPLRGNRFASNKARVKAADAVLKKLAQSGLIYVFKKWTNRWDECITCPEAWRVVGRLEGGQTQAEVAKAIGVSQSVISRIWNRFLETGSAGRSQGQGRRQATTPNEDRYLVLTAPRHRNMNATLLQQHLRSATGTTVSTQNVRNRLHGVGLYHRRPMSRFSVHPDNRRIFIWRDRGIRNNPAFLHESVRFGGGGVLVYGGISIDGFTDLYIIRNGPLTAHRYRNEILRPIVVPYAAAIGDDFILMDDYCRKHRANLVEDLFLEEGVVRMEWPTCSPDLNPIEYVWDSLGRRVASHQPPPQTLQELERDLLEEWDKIPQLVINSLIDSMPQRCSTLLAVRGNHTPY